MLLLSYHDLAEDQYEKFQQSNKQGSDVVKNLSKDAYKAFSNSPDSCFIEQEGLSRWRIIILSSSFRYIKNGDELVFEDKEQLKEYLFDIVFNNKPL